MAALPAAEGTRMKRWVWQVLLFLLIGAMVNVAVAWGCATKYLFGRHGLRLQDAAAAAKGWPRKVPESWGPPKDWAEYEYLGHTTLDVSVTVDMGGTIRSSRPISTFVEKGLRIDRVGWPLRSHQSTRVWPSDGRPDTAGVQHEYTFVSWDVGIVRATPFVGGSTFLCYFPVAPMWFGFAFDAAVYGLVVWWMSLGSRAVHRRLRMRRGLCPACAYPVGISPVCTECGKVVKPREQAQT